MLRKQQCIMHLREARILSTEKKSQRIIMQAEKECINGYVKSVDDDRWHMNCDERALLMDLFCTAFSNLFCHDVELSKWFRENKDELYDRRYVFTMDCGGGWYSLLFMVDMQLEGVEDTDSNYTKAVNIVKTKYCECCSKKNIECSRYSRCKIKLLVPKKERIGHMVEEYIRIKAYSYEKECNDLIFDTVRMMVKHNICDRHDDAAKLFIHSVLCEIKEEILLNHPLVNKVIKNYYANH